MSEELKVKRGTLDELVPDDRNMNRHTSYGMSLIEKSIRKNKFGRSILVDKNGRIIGGNGVTETAMSIGETKTIVVETTGDELVVVKRTDVDLDSQQGREMALADNATAVADIDFDSEQVKDIEADYEIDASEWGVVTDEQDEMPTDLDADLNNKPFSAKITFKDEQSCNAFISRYSNILSEEFGCIISLSGGKL